MSKRLLALIPKGMNPMQVQAMTEGVSKSLRQLGLADFTLLESGSWFKDRFASCGDWDSWIWETVNGKDYITRSNNFDGFVLCSPTLGRANASIASLALREKRVVLAWQEDEPLRIVQSINADDENNWAEGWSYETSELGD